MATTLYYADVLPGTGKTYWARKQLAKILASGEGIILYVAPTHLLLTEMKARLVSRNPNWGPRIHHVRAEELEGASASDRVYHLICGGAQADGYVVKPVKPGSVILCTHEAFTRLPSANGSLAYRSSVSVIFDEARKCLLSEYSFKLPKTLVARLFGDYVSLSMPLQFEPPPETFYPLIPRIRIGDTKAFDDLFMSIPNRKQRSQLAQLQGLLDDLRNENVDLYGRFFRSPDETEAFTLQTVLVPQRAFAGWKKIVLLSAFFTYSQLYHLLKISDAQKLEGRNRMVGSALASTQGGKYAFTLVDVTDKVVKADRVAAIKSRYEALTLTYISENSKFSMALLKNGMVLPPEGAKNVGAFARDIQAWNVSKGGKAVKPQTLALRLSREVEASSQTAKPIFERYGILHKYSHLTPLGYYAKVSAKLSRAWYRKHKQELKPVLISTNVGSRTAAAPEGSYWKREVKPNLSEGEALQLPFQCHGLNKYQGYDVLAFLATLNPRPLTVQLFNQLCPSYNANKDHTVDQAVQTAMRISVRDTDSVSNPLVILTDRNLAEEVHRHLGNLPKIVKPRTIASFPQLDIEVVPWKAPSTSPEVQERRKTKARDTQAFVRQHSKYYKEFYRLTMAERTAKKAGRLFKDADALASVKDLYSEERKALVRSFKAQSITL